MPRPRSAIRSRGHLRSGFVVALEHTELRPGRLLDEFRNGASAVRITGHPHVPSLWAAVCAEDPSAWSPRVEDLAHNHHCTGTAVHSMFGDLMFALPGELNYVAQKFAITDLAGTLTAHPALFRRGTATWTPPAAILHDAWTLVSDLVAAALPAERPAPRHHAIVQRIRYFDTLSELTAFHDLLDRALLTDSKFARLGRRIDHARAAANGLFLLKGVRDLYALARIVPVIGRVLRTLNDALGSSVGHVPTGARLIGGAHIDSKFLVGLCSVRDAIRTEYFDGDRWIELPLDPSDLVVMPGRHAARFGIRPTPHRVLHLGSEDVAGPNVTLSVGAVFGRSPIEAALQPGSEWRRAERLDAPGTLAAAAAGQTGV